MNESDQPRTPLIPADDAAGSAEDRSQGPVGDDAIEPDGAWDEEAEARSPGFWSCGAEFDAVEVNLVGPERALALLEELGPSPFERGGFPIIGFLATTYDKVTRFALEQQ